MIVPGSFEFQLQMRPVHKVFGVIMCVSALFHVYFNLPPIKRYLKNHKVAISAGALLVLLALWFAIGMN